MGHVICQQLNDARDRSVLIKFKTRFESYAVTGYVEEVGPQWMFASIVNDRIHFDGFEAFRIEDIQELNVPDPRHEFIERALELRGEIRPSRPNVDLSSTLTLVRSSREAFPLITIHREEIAPGICHIGRIVKVTPTKLELQELDLEARWEDETETYLLREVTHVGFGADYENALALVNGTMSPKPTSINE